jgi:hypothetical protein
MKKFLILMFLAAALLVSTLPSIADANCVTAGRVKYVYYNATAGPPYAYIYMIPSSGPVPTQSYVYFTTSETIIAAALATQTTNTPMYFNGNAGVCGPGIYSWGGTLLEYVVTSHW